MTRSSFMLEVLGWVLADAPWAEEESFAVGFLLGITLATGHQDYARAIRAEIEKTHSVLSSKPLRISDLEELIEAVPLA